MIEDEEQPQLLNTIGESPTEEVGTIEEDIYVLGVESLNGKTGDLSIKTINGEDLVEEGNIDLQTPLDDGQMAAVNSGIDAEKVSQIATNTQNITTLQNTKQDKLTQTQLNAVNSGIDQTKVAQIATNTGNITSNTNRITTIEGKIPSAASSSNKLTDKNYVDNAIATNTANYISDNGQPFQSYADLEAYSGPLTNNDYAFVETIDQAGNDIYTRYKYNADQNLWAEEYTITNPYFTSDQWAAINSGVTQNDVNQIDTNKGDIADLQTSKQDALSQTQLDAINSGIDATKVQQISDNTTAIATKQDKLVAGANIQIGPDGKTISATDTTYTAGTGLTLTGTQFSVTEPVPAGFFTDTAAEQTGTGSSITLNNTVNAPIDKADLKGDTYQLTYTGKNLFNKNYGSPLTSGVSVSALDTGIRVTATVAGTFKYAAYLLKDVSTLAGQSVTITLSAIAASASNLGRAVLFICKSDGTDIQLKRSIDTAGSVSFTLNASDLATRPWLGCYVYANTNGTGTIGDYVDYTGFQIEIGAASTPYEPYVGGVPSPNPSYPQDIQVVTGEQTVKVTGKNLLPLVSQSFDQGSLYYAVDAGKLKLTGSRSAEVQKNASVFKNNFSFKLAAGTYTVSCTETGSKSGTIKLYLLNKADDSILVAITKNGSDSLTLAQETEVYLGIYSYQLTITDSVLYALQIEQSFAPSAYEPYQAQTYEVNLGKNVLDSTVYYSGTGAYSPSVGDTIPNTFSPNVTSAFADDQLSISTTVQWGGVILITRSLTPGTYHIGAKVTVPSGNNARVRYHILNNANKVLEVGDYSTTAAGSTKVYDWSITLGTGETRIALAIVTSTEGGGSITATDLQIEAGSTATTYAPYFTPIELCKIGTYQDYIYKSNGNWYIHAEVGKAVYDNASSFTLRNTSTAGTKTYAINTPFPYKLSSSATGFSNCFTFFGTVTGVSVMYNASYYLDKLGFALYYNTTNPDTLFVYFNSNKTTAEILAEQNIIFYYQLATPTDTQITDATLIAQLEALASSTTYSPQTNYSVLTPTPNLPAILTVDVFKNNYAGLLARLEKAGA